MPDSSKISSKKIDYPEHCSREVILNIFNLGKDDDKQMFKV